MQPIEFLRSTLSALLRSSPTAWIVAAASGPGLFYVWLFGLERFFFFARGVELATGTAMLAVSMTFAARIATHRRSPSATPPTHRTFATCAAALVPVLATSVGYVVLLPFAYRDTSEQVACLSYSYGCPTAVEAHVIAGAVVTVVLLATLAPLPLWVLRHGANGAPLTAALVDHIRGGLLFRALSRGTPRGVRRFVP